MADESKPEDIATVRMVSEGKLSIGKAAELLDRSLHEIYRIAQDNGMRLGSTDDQRDKSRENLGLLERREEGFEDGST